jgi:lysozyme
MVLGPDVSHHQSEVDWAKVAAHGEAFGGCKVTEGLKSTDPQFLRNWSAMRKAGIDVRIAYHYAHTESSASGQADHFLSVVGPLEAGDVLCLDAEDVCPDSKKISPRDTVTWVKTFLERVVIITGLGPQRILLYTGQWWWDPRTGRSKVGAEFPLWVSDYDHDPPHVPAGWTDYAFHQFTAKDHMPGISAEVDRSRFRGSRDELRQFAGLSDVVAPAALKKALDDKGPTILPTLSNLTFRAQNADVRILQAQLVAKGFPVEVTGLYADHTKAAVAAFQLSRPELASHPDGLMGPVTLRLLFE